MLTVSWCTVYTQRTMQVLNRLNRVPNPPTNNNLSIGPQFVIKLVYFLIELGYKIKHLCSIFERLFHTGQ